MKANKMCAIFGNVTKSEGLAPLTDHRPLDTLPFDCKYRLIDFPLSSIANANINNVFMVFNEGETQSVFDHLGGGKEWMLDSLQNRYFIYFHQEFLKKKQEGLPYFESVIDYLQKSESDYTVFLGSKMLCNIDLRSVLKIHRQQQNPLTVVYKRMPKEQVFETDAILDISNEREALGYHYYSENDENGADIHLCMDIFIVQTDWLIEQLQHAQENDGPVSMQDFLRDKIGEVSSTVFEYTGYLSNIHDVFSYYQANMDMLKSDKFTSLLYSSQKIYTKLKNEVPTYYSNHSVVRNSQCATGCIIEGTVENSLLSRGTTVKEGAVIQDSLIMANATIEAGAEIAYAILDKNVTVASGVRIKGTPDQPLVIEKNQHITESILGGEAE